MSEKKTGLVKKIAITIGAVLGTAILLFVIFIGYPIYKVVYLEPQKKVAEFGHPERPVQVQISGNMLGYNVRIDEIMTCQGEYNSSFGVSGYYWYLLNPYAYQFNKDGSVFVFPLSGKMICDKGWRGMNSMIQKAVWFSSNEKPEQVKDIRYPNKELKQLSIDVIDNPDKKIPTQKYKVTWIKYVGGTPDKTKYSDVYLPYFYLTATVYDMDEWGKYNYVKDLVKDIKKVQFIRLNEETLKNLRTVNAKNDSFEKKNRNVLMSVEGNSSSINMNFIKYSDELQDRYTWRDNPLPIDKFTFQVLGADLVFPKDVNNECVNCDQFAFYFPKEKKIVTLFKQINFLSFPVSPILEEIK